MYKRKIAVVTVSRAEYGILKGLLHKMKEDPNIELQLIVTGSHLMQEMGKTINDIKNDGFSIASSIDMGLESDTPSSISKAMGTIIQMMSLELERLKPDLLVLISDRFETFAAAIAASPFTIPIAHIAGGVITQGAIDDKMRHAITKLSHLHFPVDEDGYTNLCNMGEELWRIQKSGSMAVDLLNNKSMLSRKELFQSIGLHFQINKEFILFVYHPVTLEYLDTQRQIENALEAVESVDMPVVAFYPNQDTSRSIIAEKLEDLASRNKNVVLLKHLKREVYTSLINHCRLMIGNSSSGLLEAPSYQTAVVNIGNRQKGRSQTSNVINCGYQFDEIRVAMDTVLNDEKFNSHLTSVRNPFGDGNAATSIFERLKSVSLNTTLLNKKIGGLQ